MKRQTNIPAEDIGEDKTLKKFLRLTELVRSQQELPTELNTVFLLGRILIFAFATPAGLLMVLLQAVSAFSGVNWMFGDCF